MNRVARRVLGIALGAGLVACAADRLTQPPLLVPPKPALTALAGASGDMPIGDCNINCDPAFTATLPTYADSVIAEFTVSGYVGVDKTPDADAAKTNGPKDGQGYYRINGCWLQVQFIYTAGRWGPGVCGGAFQGTWVDTAAVQGQGTITRSGRIFQWPYECNYNVCWTYSDGAEKYAIKPLWAAINLTITSGATESPPGVITLDPAGMWVQFKLSSTPVTLKGITVPIGKISWKWTPRPGGDGQTQDKCSSVTVTVCKMFFTETGSLTVSAVVNGVQQTDTLTVTNNEVFVTPEKNSMKFSIEIPDTMSKYHIIPRHAPSRQLVTVSVKDANGNTIPSKTVSLTLTGKDSTAGHMHKTGTKPAGSLQQTVVNTGASGSITVSYLAAEPSGPITIRGTSSNARAGATTIDIGMDLSELKSGTGYTLVGGTAYGGAHPKNHYATASHIAALQQLAADFYDTYGKNLYINDESLERGGLYDFDVTSHPWAPGHWGHREGNASDVHTHAPAGQPASDSLTVDQKQFIRENWKSRTDNGFKIFRHGAPDYHYHLMHP